MRISTIGRGFVILGGNGPGRRYPRRRRASIGRSGEPPRRIRSQVQTAVRNALQAADLTTRQKMQIKPMQRSAADGTPTQRRGQEALGISRLTSSQANSRHRRRPRPLADRTMSHRNARNDLQSRARASCRRQHADQVRGHLRQRDRIGLNDKPVIASTRSITQ